MAAGLVGPERTLHQAFEIWIAPEIERRRVAERLPNPFTLQMAQVLFSPSGDHVVRLNEEVRGVGRIRVAEGRTLTKGEPVRASDIEGFESIELTDEDQDLGHITVIRVGQFWNLTWNTQYNASKIARTFVAASEFLDAAKFSFQKKAGHAFVDNLYSAVELMAKAWLIATPDAQLMAARKHSTIRSKFNQRSRLGNVEREFVTLYNELTNLRSSARYVSDHWVFDPARGEGMLLEAEHMYATLEKQRPRRDAT